MKAYLIPGLAIPMLVAVSLPAAATTIHVPDDEPTIQAGIDAASYGDTVLVDCGAYYEYDIIMKSGVHLTSETGLADCVRVDAQQQGRVFYCSAVDSLTSVVGFTITGGLAAGLHPDGCGGGMYCHDASLTIIDCMFSENQATGSDDIDSAGGGMYCYYASPTLIGCTFLDNHTTGTVSYGGGSGGGICCWGNSSATLTDCTFSGNHHGLGASTGGGMSCQSNASPTLTYCTFSGNQAMIGGGMYCWSGSSPALTSCTFLGNQAMMGGGMYCDYASPTLNDCAFSGNQATSWGGGMVCSDDASPTLTDCTFSENSAATSGGGMYFRYNSSATLTRCTFLGNEASSGGGMFCINCLYSCSPTLTECTFSDNQATGSDDTHGGGMYCWSSHPTLTDCTFSGNQASSGGGIYCYNSPALTRCIIAFSTQGEAVFCLNANGATLTCCDVYGNVGGDWVSCIADQYGVNGNFSADPLFCDMTIEDFTLASNSPCLPGGNDCSELIGAHGWACEESPVQATSWGAIKAMYR